MKLLKIGQSLAKLWEELESSLLMTHTVDVRLTKHASEVCFVEQSKIKTQEQAK